MKTLPARITISRPQGPDPEEIRIEITCNTSRRRAVEVKLSLEGFAKALTGSGWLLCQMEFDNSGLIGMKAENKEETIELPKGTFATRENENRYVKPFEVDGWRRRSGDWTNGHRQFGNKVSVVFFRHVDADGKGIEP